MKRENVLGYLDEKMKKNGYYIGATAGSGALAQLLTEYGADFVLALSSGRIRQMGSETSGGFLPFENSNRLVLNYAIKEVLPRISKIPVIFGLCATDPTIEIDNYLDMLSDSGFSGIINYPSVGIFEGKFGEALEEAGAGYGMEAEAIRIAHQKNLFTIGCVFNVAQAQMMIDAGADMICAYCDMGAFGGGVQKNISVVNEILNLASVENTFSQTIFAGNTKKMNEVRYISQLVNANGLIGDKCFEETVFTGDQMTGTNLLLKKVREQEFDSDEVQQRFNRKEDYVLYVIDYIKKHYKEKVSFNEIADKINISRSYLSTLFNQTVDCTFLEFLTNFRMEKALELMKEKQVSLYVLAEMVGYDDYAHFSKVFKRKMGVCPKKFVS